MSGVSETVEVFWRPGCPYCLRLRGELLDHGVEAEWHNIWVDAHARELVRAANNGNETVPTVRIGDRTLTNPSWRQLAPVLGRDPREPSRPPSPPPYASPGACVSPPRAQSRPSAGLLRRTWVRLVSRARPGGPAAPK
jgi:glutaredoxin